MRIADGVVGGQGEISFESIRQDVRYAGGFIGRAGLWVCTFVQERFYRLCNAFRACCWDVDAVAVVVLEGWAKVPAVGCFAVPSGAMGRAVVHKYLQPGGRWGCGCNQSYHRGVGRQTVADVVVTARGG